MLAAQRDALRKEREGLATNIEQANQVYDTVAQNALHGHQYSPSQRKAIDSLMQKRGPWLKRHGQIESVLCTIQKDGVVIKKNCTASPDEIHAAIQAYKIELREAEGRALGMQLATLQRDGFKRARAALKRLSPWAERTSDKELMSLAQMAGLSVDT